MSTPASRICTCRMSGWSRPRASGQAGIPVFRSVRLVLGAAVFFADFGGGVSDRDKNRYSAFYNTDFYTIFSANGIRTLVFTGVVTNVCVETSAREAFVRDYYVVVVSDGTAAYVAADHDMTLKNIDRFFGEIASMDELTAVWPARNTTGRGQRGRCGQKTAKGCRSKWMPLFSDRGVK